MINSCKTSLPILEILCSNGTTELLVTKYTQNENTAPLTVYLSQFRAIPFLVIETNTLVHHSPFSVPHTTYIINQQILLILPSRYVHNLTTSHLLHSYYLGPSHYCLLWGLLKQVLTGFLAYLQASLNKAGRVTLFSHKSYSVISSISTHLRLLMLLRGKAQVLTVTYKAPCYLSPPHPPHLLPL